MEDKKTGIKSWSEQDRPREKLLNKGSHALSDSELLAILINTGTKDQTAVDLAKSLLDVAENDLSKLGLMSVKQIMNIKGLKEAKAITIAAALELGRRRKENISKTKEIITNSKSVYDYVYPFFADSEQEKFIVLLLNRANFVLKKEIISTGGVTGTVVDPKIIFKKALEEPAVGIVLCHNHPSGSKKPSQSDILLTNKIRDGAKLLEITVLDHLIFTESGYFSFADEGIL